MVKILCGTDDTGFGQESDKCFLCSTCFKDVEHKKPPSANNLIVLTTCNQLAAQDTPAAASDKTQLQHEGWTLLSACYTHPAIDSAHINGLSGAMQCNLQRLPWILLVNSMQLHQFRSAHDQVALHKTARGFQQKHSCSDLRFCLAYILKACRQKLALHQCRYYMKKQHSCQHCTSTASYLLPQGRRHASWHVLKPLMFNSVFAMYEPCLPYCRLHEQLDNQIHAPEWPGCGQSHLQYP